MNQVGRALTLHTFLIVTTLLAAVCGGCGPMRNADGGYSYSMFYTPVDHAAELLEQNRLQEAARVHDSHTSAFSLEEAGEEGPVLERELAQRLLAAHSSEAEAAAAALSQLRWPIDFREWSVARAVMARGGKALRSIDHAVLRDGRFHPEILDRLRAAYSGLDNAMRIDAPGEFAGYPLAEAPDFFRSYPVAINAKPFFETYPRSLIEALHGKTPAQVLTVRDIYGSYLGDEGEAVLGSAFYKAVLAGKADPAVAPSAAAVTETLAEVAARGFRLREIPGTQAVLIVVESGRSGLFGLEAETALPVPVRDGRGFVPEAPEADIVFAVILRDARTERLETGKRSLWSRYLAGYHRYTNPDWIRYTNDLRRAQDDLEKALDRNIYSWEKSIDIPEDNEDAERAWKNYRYAGKRLRRVDRYVSKPYYANYSYSVTTLRVTRSAELEFHVFDRRRGEVRSRSYRSTEHRDFRTAAGVHPEDPDRGRILGRLDSPASVDSYESSPWRQRLEDLIAKAPGMPEPCPDFETFRRRYLYDMPLDGGGKYGPPVEDGAGALPWKRGNSYTEPEW